MFFWIVQQTIMSFILIILVHYIYIFFKNNLTTPKIKDLVNKPSQQYNEIYKSMADNTEVAKPNEPPPCMKDELTSYLKSLTVAQKTVEAGANNLSNNFSDHYATISTS